ncbi:MCP four helix bundle domain-containing protein, partial [Variovorax sp. LARHSF232]
MNAFYNLKIATKLMVAFVAVLALSAFIGIFSMLQLSKVNDMSTQIAKDWMPSTRALLEMKSSMARFRAQEIQFATAVTESDLSYLEKGLAGTLEAWKKQRARYEELISAPEEKTLYADYAKAFDLYMREHERMVAAVRSQRDEQAESLTRGESRRLNGEMMGTIDKLVEVNVAGADKASETADHLYGRARGWIIGLLLGSIALGLALALTIARIVARPLSEAVRVAQAVAGGDLGSRIEVTTRDETGQLLEALREMNGSLVRIVSEVRTGTDNIATASGQIASGNQDLSSRTEEQASSLEQTAASMEELTSTVKQNADN